MTLSGIQMLMEKLNQLINCNDIPFINNNPEIISQRPQFQLLYEELDSMIQILEHQEPHHLEKLIHMKKRFTDAAEEAHYIVDMFLSDAHNRNYGHLRVYDNDVNVNGSFKSVLNLFLSCVRVRSNQHLPFDSSLNLDCVRRSFKSVMVEFMNMRIDNKKMDSSGRPERTPASQISISGNSQRSKKVLDEIVVGLDHDVELIRDKLVDDQKKVDVVSLVGMGGIGKTALATKVFNDAYVKHHFYVRVWVTVSQTYDKRDVLVQILESIRGQLHHLEKASDAQLRELVHKNLMGKRYLIVIDDIWHIQTWNSLKLLFPHDNNGSRILLTTRLTEVAKHANSLGLIHHLGYLNKERSWELLCQKVFNGNESPEWSVKPGMKIVENCKGLPLAIVVIAGVLAKKQWNTNLWMEIAERTSSYIVGEKNGCMETLGLSYNHLPLHLRECFLYLGGFPEDYKFLVRRLIWLWIAEGFIQEDGNRSLEDIAEGYLMDLIDRNLVTVANRSISHGGVRVCKVHDLVRELCLEKAREERFILETKIILFYQFFEVNTTPYKQVRKFINTRIPDLNHLSTQNLRSILWFSDFRSLSGCISTYIYPFVLLRVLDIQNCTLSEFPRDMELLVHLRYLAIWKVSAGFPSSICNLWNLKTLSYITDQKIVVLPSNISDLVNLRHLWGWKSLFVFGSIEKAMNLQTISRVRLKDEAQRFQKYFPCIKKLTCRTKSIKQNDFGSLTYLERLSLWSYHAHEKNHLTFPATLRTLKLGGCLLPWSDMSIIQLLPNLQVLKLRLNAFEGSCWNTDGQVFSQLNFLRLEMLDIKRWEAYGTSFPCLKKLEVFNCLDLKEIPLETGDIPTLELIKIKNCIPSVGDSVRRIQQDQQDMGNYDLKIDV